MGILSHYVNDRNVSRYGNQYILHSHIDDIDDYTVSNNGWLQPTMSVRRKRGWLCLIIIAVCLFVRFVISNEMTLDAALSWNPSTPLETFDHYVRNLTIVVAVLLFYITVLQRLDKFGNSKLFVLINSCMMFVYYLCVAMFTIVYLWFAFAMVVEMLKGLFAHNR